MLNIIEWEWVKSFVLWKRCLVLCNVIWTCMYISYIHVYNCKYVIKSEKCLYIVVFIHAYHEGWAGHLDNNCQGILRQWEVHGYGYFLVKQLLNEDTESAEVMESSRQFHCATVNGVKEFPKSVCLTLGTINIFFVKFPLTGLWFRERSICFGGTATCPFKVLCMKTRRLIRRLSSRGSKLSCVRRSVTLAFQV